jgi:hypothetical protein
VTESRYAPKKTLAPENQALIECPVFKVNTRIATCFELRDMVWAGRRPEQRKGCQVALCADKCPINHIIKEMIAKDDDPYHATTPEVVPLRQSILDRIAPVLIMETTIDRGMVSDKERELLFKCNEETSAGVKLRAAPRKRKAAEPISTVEEEPAETSATIKAAISGDLSKAINAEEGA